MSYFTVDQIAAAYRVKRDTVWRWAAAGKLVGEMQSKKTGWRFSLEAIKQFEAKNPKYAGMMRFEVGNQCNDDS